MRSPKARDQGPRERPILFNETMVRRLLDGRKTQSRRPLSAQPAPNRPHDGGTVWRLDPRTGRHVPYGSVSHLTAREKMGICCPYSLPGDRLWVRETWCQRKDQAFVATRLRRAVPELSPCKEEFDVQALLYARLGITQQACNCLSASVPMVASDGRRHLPLLRAEVLQ